MAEEIIGIEVQGEIHAIKDEAASTKTEAESLMHKGIRTPLFTLDNMEAQSISSNPTSSNKVTVTGTGVFTPTQNNFKNFKCSLQFFSDCIVGTKVQVVREGEVPAEGNGFGSAEFRIHADSIKTLLKEKYPTRNEEIDNYVDNVISTFINQTGFNENESIARQGEPGADCLTLQKAERGAFSDTYFGIKYVCGMVIKVISQGTYGGSYAEYHTFLPIKIKAS